jgi:hypothetical protein
MRGSNRLYCDCTTHLLERETLSFTWRCAVTEARLATRAQGKSDLIRDLVHETRSQDESDTDCCTCRRVTPQQHGLSCTMLLCPRHEKKYLVTDRNGDVARRSMPRRGRGTSSGSASGSSRSRTCLFCPHARRTARHLPWAPRTDAQSFKLRTGRLAGRGQINRCQAAPASTCATCPFSMRA